MQVAISGGVDDKSRLYRLYYNDEYVLTTNRRGLAYYLDLELWLIAPLFSGNSPKSRPGYTIQYEGKLEKIHYLYKMKGTVEELMEMLDLSKSTLRNRLNDCGYLVEYRVNGLIADLVDLEDVKRLSKKENKIEEVVIEEDSEETVSESINTVEKFYMVSLRNGYVENYFINPEGKLKDLKIGFDEPEHAERICEIDEALKVAAAINGKITETKT